MHRYMQNVNHCIVYLVVVSKPVKYGVKELDV